MKLLCLPADRAHDALNDTRNTVRICDRMDLLGCIEEYRTAYVCYAEDRRSGLISGKVYADRNAALTDDTVGTVVCPYCGERVALDLTTAKSGVLLGYAQCGEGDEFLANIQCFRHAGNTCKVKRMVYEMSADLWDIYQQAKENA